ncbi:MAG TPA: S49 family peptidase, partial [Reyranellaceae bacterium]|nr:S49 family peptidase [Reyranellaceae bacterium]
MWRYIVGLLATLGGLALLAVLGIVALVTSGPFAGKSLPKQMVLAVDLRNVPAESVSSDLLSGGLFRSQRDLTHVLETLWRAAEDPRVVGLFVDIGDEQAGLARVQELRQALARVRGQGKFVIGFAESFGGSASHIADYYLATALEQIWLQPSGNFAVTGLAVETPFVRGGLDKLGVRIEGGKRMEYKSAPDSFTQTGLTGPGRENLQQ